MSGKGIRTREKEEKPEERKYNTPAACCSYT
jgi:hypothetical protein